MVLTISTMSSVIGALIVVETSMFRSMPAAAGSFFELVHFHLQSGCFVNQLLNSLQIEVIQRGQTMDFVGKGVQIDKQFCNWF